MTTAIGSPTVALPNPLRGAPGTPGEGAQLKHLQLQIPAADLLTWYDDGVKEFIPAPGANKYIRLVDWAHCWQPVSATLNTNGASCVFFYGNDAGYNLDLLYPGDTIDNGLQSTIKTSDYVYGIYNVASIDILNKPLVGVLDEPIETEDSPDGVWVLDLWYYEVNVAVV